ncbi:cell wall hydrolase [Lentibacillus saliphilus]|uniref:cell wall hydrolase n=1 Tax=Lentibacillus saliphilus TaxID=2737028 RepID=UPI001C2F45F7|nr:cell wall hydrolase [Lentibacillus saliphilus]
MKLIKTIVAAALAVTLFAVPVSADAASYQVKKGDSFWLIANKHHISVADLMRANNRTNSLLYAGETINIPGNGISQADRVLMAKLVNAEAKGEPYAGKVAVATVVLNRVDHKSFPNTVRGVIYERVSGHYAFTPVQNGAINNGYTATDMRAVNEAVAFRGQGRGSIYFYNPKTAVSNWIKSRETTVTIGNHRFAK